MRKHSRRIKTRRRRNSRKLKEAIHSLDFWIGQQAPWRSTGVTTARVESDEFNHHQKQAEAKQQQLNELNAKCEEFQNTGRAEMESAIAKHQQSVQELARIEKIKIDVMNNTLIDYKLRKEFTLVHHNWPKQHTMRHYKGPKQHGGLQTAQET